MLPALLIFEIVLLLHVNPADLSIVTTVIQPVAPEILLNVLPVKILVGPFTLDTPSVLFHPKIVVAPGADTFEKLFPVSVMVEPFTEAPIEIRMP